MATEIKGGDDQASYRSGRLLDHGPGTGQREYRAVVVAIGVKVEE